MAVILKNTKIYQNGKFDVQDLYINENGVCKGVVDSFSSISDEFNNCYIFPGFVDVHVHLREPGFSYKETIESGTKACAHGGYTAVCSMPNLNPVPHNQKNLKKQLDLIEKDAVIDVFPYASITVNQAGETLSDLENMADLVAGFSDDGKGVQNPDLMKEAMIKAKELNKIIVAHCEDNSLLFSGYIHDGNYAKEHSHKGICSESEWGPIKRDIGLLKKTGAAYHVCHISTKESVELIRQAKKDGLNITCETAPHYLVLCDDDLQEDGKFKMNPPLRSAEDRRALIDGIKDGTIDMIATDHAPHSEEEKSKGLQSSAFGIVGIETAFSVMYTHFVKTGIITLEKLIELMSTNPRKRFNIPCKNSYSVWNLDKEYVVDPQTFLSKGKSTPFEGEKLFGECILTVHNNKIVYRHSDI